MQAVDYASYLLSCAGLRGKESVSEADFRANGERAFLSEEDVALEPPLVEDESISVAGDAGGSSVAGGGERDKKAAAPP
eukprot:715334-Prymnesium_polylepis.1